MATVVQRLSDVVDTRRRDLAAVALAFENDSSNMTLRDQTVFSVSELTFLHTHIPIGSHIRMELHSRFKAGCSMQ